MNFLLALAFSISPLILSIDENGNLKRGNTNTSNFDFYLQIINKCFYTLFALKIKLAIDMFFLYLIYSYYCHIRERNYHLLDRSYEDNLKDMIKINNNLSL